MGEHETTASARDGGGYQQNGPPEPGTRARAARGRGPAQGAGTALAVVAVAGTAFGAMLLRPGGSLLAKSGGPLDNTVVVILLAAGCLAAGLVLGNRYRARLGYDQNLPSFEQRLADAVRMTLVAAAVLIPVLLLSMHRFPSGGGSNPAPEPTRDVTFPHPTFPPPPPHQEGKPGHGSHISVPHLVFVFAIAALAVVLLLAAYRLWRQLRAGPAPAPDAYRPAADEQDVLAEAVDSGRRALLDGTDARAAVIACYAAMEASLARSGIARRASDSPQDLLERAAGSGLLTGTHAIDLTGLFREARYSTHPMDHTHRDRAAGALDAIAGQLAERAEAAAAQAGDATPGPQPTAGADR